MLKEGVTVWGVVTAAGHHDLKLLLLQAPPRSKYLIIVVLCDFELVIFHAQVNYGVLLSHEPLLLSALHAYYPVTFLLLYRISLLLRNKRARESQRVQLLVEGVVCI